MTYTRKSFSLLIMILIISNFAAANDDFVVFTAAASPGDTIEIFGNGKRWFVYGHVKDLTNADFSTQATSIA